MALKSVKRVNCNLVPIVLLQWLSVVNFDQLLGVFLMLLQEIDLKIIKNEAK